jgi:tetratricopeptide (TPR) repeat protein
MRNAMATLLRFSHRVSWIYLATLVLVMGGCASSHNYRLDGANPLGGGFSDRELKPGFYELLARSNAAPWASFDAARATWTKRAHQLCGDQGFLEIVQSEDSGRSGTMPSYVRGQVFDLPRYNTSIAGYVLCKSAGITLDEAHQYLNEIRAAAATERLNSFKAQLANLGGSNCSEVDPAVTAETYFQRGKVLIALNQYDAAMRCLQKALEGEKDTYIYRESCFLIATMYELGWGVGKNMETASMWRKKAGL